MELIFCSTVPTNGESTRLCQKGVFFAFFGTGSGMADSDWQTKFHRKRSDFFSLSRRVFLTKQNLLSPPINLKIGFSSLKEIFKT